MSRKQTAEALSEVEVPSTEPLADVAVAALAVGPQADAQSDARVSFHKHEAWLAGHPPMVLSPDRLITVSIEKLKRILAPASEDIPTITPGDGDRSVGGMLDAEARAGIILPGIVVGSPLSIAVRDEQMSHITLLVLEVEYSASGVLANRMRGWLKRLQGRYLHFVTTCFRHTPLEIKLRIWFPLKAALPIASPADWSTRKLPALLEELGCMLVQGATHGRREIPPNEIERALLINKIPISNRFSSPATSYALPARPPKDWTFDGDWERDIVRAAFYPGELLDAAAIVADAQVVPVPGPMPTMLELASRGLNLYGPTEE